MAEPSVDSLAEPTADVAGGDVAVRDIAGGDVAPGWWGGLGDRREGPPGEDRPGRLGVGLAVVGGPVGVADRLGPAGHGGRGGPGAQREGGGLLAVDDEAGRCGVGAEVGEACSETSGATWRDRAWASSGDMENHTLVRALEETVSRSSLGSWPRCWWARTMERR